jgi:LDH2 family malate/lactate/ureidoglycolate dehydrogenase
VAPGDLELEAGEERQERGIPLTEADFEALREIDAEVPPEERDLS